MEYNNIRNYNNLTNNGIIPVEKYILKRIPLISEEDRDYCLRLLTIANRHVALCHDYFSSNYINTVIEDCDYLLFFHKESSIDAIVAFSLVRFQRKRRGKILNIALLCALPNHRKFGQMMANAVHSFAVARGCPFLYVSPRTDALRTTFIKYGFEPIFGKKGRDEVLEKEIDSKFITVPKTNRTRKHLRTHRK